MNLKANHKTYYVYLVQCSDNTYYCGYTTNLERRINEHNNSKRGSKYTSNKRPVILKYFESFSSLSLALKREYEIKQLNRKAKEGLFAS